jgi:hypothetical protein
MTTLLLALALQPILWEDDVLELYRGRVSEAGDRPRIELCVRPKDGIEAGSTYVGYARYRAAWRWGDCVVAGLERSHVLSTSVEKGPVCFSVLVPPNAEAIELPIGEQTIEIPVKGSGTVSEKGTVPFSGAVPFSTVPDPLSSDVDGEVPASLSARPHALAVVLGIESYANAPAARFADDDATTAARYFEKSLGIPAARIELLRDREVTLGQMQRVFGADGWLARRVTPDSEVFVYFAGHGMAELEKFSPYLLPVDGDPDYLHQTGLSVDKLIDMVGAVGARRTTLFLDACFSGLSREGASLLAGARPLVIEQAPRAPAGLSIFSAGSGGQIVSSIEQEGHGIFSYYLFKGLAGDADLDHDRRVVASELKSYLEDEVPRAAQTIDREQTPGIVLADGHEVLVQLP